jgi:hypothetical protein
LFGGWVTPSVSVVEMIFPFASLVTLMDFEYWVGTIHPVRSVTMDMTVRVVFINLIHLSPYPEKPVCSGTRPVRPRTGCRPVHKVRA